MFSGIAAAQADPPIKLTYTARLLGWARFPEQQAPANVTCEAAPEKMTGAAARFYKLLRPDPGAPASLIVGMGDNFAPHINARTFVGIPQGVPVPAYLNIPRPEKDLFFWDGHLWQADPTNVEPAPDIPTDNVGCFLRNAGYDAVVVGHEDFYYGPNRIRELARFLAKPIGSLHPTAMLGANLSVVTSVPDANARLPLYYTQHYFEKENRERQALQEPTFGVLFLPCRDYPAVSVTLPDTVMPWLREFKVDNAFMLKQGDKPFNVANLPGKNELWASANGTSRVHSLTSASETSTVYVGTQENRVPLKLVRVIDAVQLCVNMHSDPSAFQRPGSGACIDVPEEDECTERAPKSGCLANPLSSSEMRFQLKGEVLKGGQNWAICVHYVHPVWPQTDYACQPFSVATPLLTYTRMGDTGGEDDPFTIVTVGDRKIVVFGLVDPTIQNTIGRFNYGYLNEKKRYETVVNVGGLRDAMAQAWMRCQLVEVCRNENTPKVLLAQMPGYKVSQFVATLDTPIVFSAVITQTDSSHPTGNAEIERTDVDLYAQPNLVLTPGEIYSSDSPNQIKIQIQTASVYAHTGTPRENELTVDWTVTNHVKSDKAGFVDPQLPFPAAGELSLQDAAEQTLRALDPPSVNVSTWSSSQVLQRLALTVMKHKHPADLAMIQARDLFEPASYAQVQVTPDNLQEILDRVFWKSDYGIRLPIAGATLVSVMQQSAAFAAQDMDPLNTDTEKGRGLVTLGIFKEPANQNWIVNGNILDSSKLYSAVISDFIAFGDTGYAQLQPTATLPQYQNPANTPAFRVTDFKRLDPISAMVCRDVRAAVPPLKNAKCLGEPLPAHDFQDISKALPPDTTAGFTPWRQTWNYLWPWLKYHKAVDLFNGQDDANIAAQQKPFWSLDVEKGDLSTTINLHRAFRGYVGSINGASVLSLEFPGVQNSTITAPNSYLISYDNRTRLRRSWRPADFYLLDDLSYSFSRTQDSSDTGYARSLSLNSAAIESGTLLHLLPEPRLLSVDGKRRGPARFGRKLFQLDLLTAFRFETQPLSPRENISLPGNATPGSCPSCTNSVIASGTIKGTLERSRNTYAKIGLRAVDDRSWMEAGVLTGRNFSAPSSLSFVGSDNNAYRVPLGAGECFNMMPYTLGSSTTPVGSTCTPDTLGRYPAPPMSDTRLTDWIRYLSTNNLITANTPFKPNYVDRPQNGVFFNFSLNVPFPAGDLYARRAGKGIAILFENSGQFFFGQHQDLPTQTRYYDRLANSIVIPMLGNFSFKPEIDLIYYESKIDEIPFRAVQYMGTLSYTFSWRQGQPWGRALRFPTPAPTASVPTSGR